MTGLYKFFRLSPQFFVNIKSKIFVKILSTNYDKNIAKSGRFSPHFFVESQLCPWPHPGGGPPAIFRRFFRLQIPHHLWSRGFQVTVFNEKFQHFTNFLQFL